MRFLRDSKRCFVCCFLYESVGLTYTSLLCSFSLTGTPLWCQLVHMGVCMHIRTFCIHLYLYACADAHTHIYTCMNAAQSGNIYHHHVIYAARVIRRAQAGGANSSIHNSLSLSLPSSQANCFVLFSHNITYCLLCWQVSRAERVSSFSFLCRELGVCRLQVSRAKSDERRQSFWERYTQ